MTLEAVSKLVEKWHEEAAEALAQGLDAQRAQMQIHLADELAAALVAEGQGAARPNVQGASPVCLDCNNAGIRNCSHFDNCDGTWVYKPDAAAPSLHKEGAHGLLKCLEPDGPSQCRYCNEFAPKHLPDCPGSALEGHKEGAGGEPLKSVLAEHWLSGIHCHHAISPDDSTYDWATCACSKVNLPHRGTVGEAVGTWIEHVLDELAAASPAGRAGR